MSHAVVTFYSRGVRMEGELFLPAGSGAVPGIVFCHGFGGVRQQFLDDYARQFCDWGYACLTFDYRGFGGSDGEKGALFPLRQIEDIRAAVTLLAAHERTDEARIALYGTSFGGGNVVYAAGTDPRVACTVSVVGFGDGERWMRSLRRYWEWCDFRDAVERDRVDRVLTGKSAEIDPNQLLIRDPEAAAHEVKMRAENPARISWRLTLEMADAVLAFKPESVVASIAPRPICFIAAERDRLTPLDEVVSMYEKAGEPKRLVVLPGLAHHDIYYGDNLPLVLSSARAWLDEHLMRARGEA